MYMMILREKSKAGQLRQKSEKMLIESHSYINVTIDMILVQVNIIYIFFYPTGFGRQAGRNLIMVFLQYAVKLRENGYNHNLLYPRPGSVRNDF